MTNQFATEDISKNTGNNFQYHDQCKHNHVLWRRQGYTEEHRECWTTYYQKKNSQFKDSSDKANGSDDTGDNPRNDEDGCARYNRVPCDEGERLIIDDKVNPDTNASQAEKLWEKKDGVKYMMIGESAYQDQKVDDSKYNEKDFRTNTKIAAPHVCFYNDKTLRCNKGL